MKKKKRNAETTNVQYVQIELFGLKLIVARLTETLLIAKRLINSISNV